MEVTNSDGQRQHGCTRRATERNDQASLLLCAAEVPVARIGAVVDVLLLLAIGIAARGTASSSTPPASWLSLRVSLTRTTARS